MIEKKQNVNDYSIQLNPELQKIFSEIIRDSQYSSSELLKKYLETPEFQIYSEQLRNKWQELLQQIMEERKKHMELSNQEFFSFILNQYSVKIIERIKENYAGKLTHEILDRLNNFNLEIKNDESFKHDMTAYPDKSLISINMAYFAKGKSLEQQVVQAMGTMPHEIFHFIFQILKPKQLADERMVFKLADGNTASSLGMVGHMLNEGFVEKLSSDFCEKHGIFYAISPSYIQFVNLCNYIMEHNPQITEDFLLKHDYDDILRMCSSDVVETYKKTERIEYANRFSLKMPDGSYRNIKSNEILESFNQPVDTNSNIFGRRYNYYIRNYRFGDLKHNSYEKLLQIAKQNGFSSLGFCEHIPNLNLILPDEDNRMLLSEVKEYIDSINTLKRDNPDMTILTGFETEYDPMKEDFLGQMKERADYMVLNQHYVPQGLEIVQPLNNPNYPIEYANMVSKAIDSGIFDIIAYPDFFMKFRDLQLSEENKKRFDENAIRASQIICEKASDMGIPIEFSLSSDFINKLSNGEDVLKPSLIFWQVAEKVENLKVINGIDLNNLEIYESANSIRQYINTIEQLIGDKLIQGDYNPLVERENNHKLQEAYKKGQKNALTYETQLINMTIRSICDGLPDGLTQDEIALEIDKGLDMKMQTFIDDASKKNQNTINGLEKITDNPEMTLSTKKLEVTRKKKAVEETDQVLVNQQGVMGNAKKNLTNAIKMGCNTSQEFTDVITQMTEYDSTNKVEHKVDIESQLSKFEESKSNANTLTSTNNLVLTKTPNTSINNNGSANIILIILLVTFAIGFVFGVTYVFCRLWING